MATVICLDLSATGTTFAQRVVVNSGLLLTNVTVVDTHTGKLTPRRSVAIQGGKITKN